MSEAAKRRRKRAQREFAAQNAGLPGLAPSKKREPNGCFRERIRQQGHDEPDARIEALTARVRHMGHKMGKAELIEAAKPWHGCEAGRAMAAHVPVAADRETLWQAIQHMRRVWVAYDRAMGAPNRHAQCLRIMLPAEEFHADADAAPRDDRTDEEKQAGAIRARATVAEWLKGVEARAVAVALSVVIDDKPCRDADALVRALWCVADGNAGRRVVDRSL
jgi:hypothetical protein